MNDTTLQRLALHGQNVIQWTNGAWVLTVTVLVLLLAHYPTRRVPFPNSAPPLVKGNLPVVGALRFFTSRGTFLKEGASASKTGNFSFYVGKHRVVGVSGLDGRRAFYESKQLSSHQGYEVLLSASPGHGNADPEDAFATWFSRKLIKLLKREYFVKILPHLISDASSFYERLASHCGPDNTSGSTGMFDPFVEMNRIVFQLTMRTVGAAEIAAGSEHDGLLARSFDLVRQIGDNSSTARIIVPWLPTWRHVKRVIAAGRFHRILDGLARERERTGRREDDAMQLLLDEGESGTKIVEWIVLAVLAGQLNSGWNAAWVFCFLAMDPHWMREVRAEVDRAVAKHRSGDPKQTPLDVLSNMGIDDWERDFPLVNLCLHESIRIVTVGAGFRRNISGKDVPIGRTGDVIPPGAFAAFHIDQIHMDPQIYTDPTRFDPARFLPGREEDKKVPLAYAGWGQGRHPCCEFSFDFSIEFQSRKSPYAYPKVANQ
ncbi:hypothetical protein FJTKL_03199 [Diaporthe vaccinii]|uniref:Cytochrome P450 n=1 Tax=Diaporthe vaccinii TaxID=105482 RepID=A0ABR4DVQ8_9PEZI